MSERAGRRAEAREASTHRYVATCSWRGSTSVGYDAYDRSHDATVPPVPTALALSSDPAFRGDPSRPNPEQLLVLAAASCQLLSFLAVAARARVDVVAYDDSAEGVMPDSNRPMWITEIVLHPRITVNGDVDEARVRHLCDVAHRECFVAASLRTDVRVEPEITIGAGSA